MWQTSKQRSHLGRVLKIYYRHTNPSGNKFGSYCIYFKGSKNVNIVLFMACHTLSTQATMFRTVTRWREQEYHWSSGLSSSSSRPLYSSAALSPRSSEIGRFLSLVSDIRRRSIRRRPTRPSKAKDRPWWFWREQSGAPTAPTRRGARVKTSNFTAAASHIRSNDARTVIERRHRRRRCFREATRFCSQTLAIE